MQVISTNPADNRMAKALQKHVDGIHDSWAVVLGDRVEMLKAAIDLRHRGKRLVHIGGGDTPRGTKSHPDHDCRDAISMLSDIHCVSNERAKENLAAIGVCDHVYVTGNPGLDEVVGFMRGWTVDTPSGVVVQIHPHPSNWGKSLRWVADALDACPNDELLTWLPPNNDDGGKLRRVLEVYLPLTERLDAYAYLRTLFKAKSFITNSSAGVYEAPILGVHTTLIGDRQANRVGPFHHKDGAACEEIARICREVCK